MSDRHHRSHRHHHDRDYRDDRRSRDHYDYRRSRDRDSRDSNRDYYNQRRVPGHVSDPGDHFEDVDKTILKGQRETVARVQEKPPSYVPPATVTQPYRKTFTDPYTETPRRSFYNANFLSVLPALVGIGLLIAALSIPEWSIDSITTNNEFRITRRGLFQVCSFTLTPERGPTTCQTFEEFAASGTDGINDLIQATRGLVIISAILGFFATGVALILGLNRWENKKGSFISGGVLAFAGACGIAGMGCFSGFLAERVESPNEARYTVAGTSFFLGWCGVGFLLVASVTSFLSHCARKKKRDLFSKY